MATLESAGSYWQVPRLRADQRWLGGVAAAVATELGLAPLWIRVAFVLLTLASGVGLAAYAALWLWLTLYGQRQRRHAASHLGELDRPSVDLDYVPVPKGANPERRALGVVLIVVGLLWLSRRWLGAGAHDTALWPVAMASFGMLLAWSSGKVDWSAPHELLRAVAGLLLVALGVISFIALNFSLAVAPRALLIATAVLSAVVLIVAPWLWRAASQVGEERLKRTRADERAELAAHLHDSVLQTLSLIQRNADDKQATVNLARRQERELREWLYGRSSSAQNLRSPSGLGFRAALQQLGAEVEELHHVPVEVVVVGDGPLDERVASALGAAREALVNSARHSGAPRVDVYGELTAERLEIFVRDTGSGFDPTQVPEDRRGLRDSVARRMERAGGSANIVSAPGQGCEVSLLLPRGAPLPRGATT
jgi:signal transduction histidine kinase/phage shock protein PspC (stress-responsive transcriptional regulator)